jgi:hypothetical protein
VGGAHAGAARLVGGYWPSDESTHGTQGWCIILFLLRTWTHLYIDICDFDITRDLPVGILHALILGPAKYHAGVTKATLDAAGLDSLQVYMEAAPTACVYDAKQLNAAYMIKHANSLVGKELKVLAQTASGFLAPLLARGIISQEHWLSWHTLGQLARVLLVEQVAEVDRKQYMVSNSSPDLIHVLIQRGLGGCSEGTTALLRCSCRFQA